jgi:hypothetical protein
MVELLTMYCISIIMYLATLHRIWGLDHDYVGKAIKFKILWHHSGWFGSLSCHFPDFFRGSIVATLALGSRPRQRGYKVVSQEEARKSRQRGRKGVGQEEARDKKKPRSHITYFWECKKVWGSMREWTLTLPRQLPLWKMESRWTSKTLKSNFRGQNSMACGVLYIIEKLLELKCLKWVRIAHLDIWNTSYGQKKGRESNYQFDSWPEKVKNRPDLLSCRGRVIYRWKVLDKSYNFALYRISIQGLIAKLWGSKVTGVSTGAISGLPLGSPGREKPFGCRLRGQPQSIL